MGALATAGVNEREKRRRRRRRKRNEKNWVTSVRAESNGRGRRLERPVFDVPARGDERGNEMEVDLFEEDFSASEMDLMRQVELLKPLMSILGVGVGDGAGAGTDVARFTVDGRQCGGDNDDVLAILSIIALALLLLYLIVLATTTTTAGRRRRRDVDPDVADVGKRVGWLLLLLLLLLLKKKTEWFAGRRSIRSIDREGPSSDVIGPWNQEKRYSFVRFPSEGNQAAVKNEADD